MSYDSVARTLLGIEKMGVPNVGILLDFGHFLFKHDLFGKPVPTFPDHALNSAFFSLIRLAAAISKTPKQELLRSSAEIA